MRAKYCRNCIHFYVCGYLKQFEHNLSEMLESVGWFSPEHKYKRIYTLLAEKCKYYNKECKAKKQSKLKQLKGSR